MLAQRKGLVLDLGGGNGVARHYLSSSAEYVSIDPNLAWLRPEWQHCLARHFPCQVEPLAFVRGIGEQLPFRSEVFDCVIAFWSLNHVNCLTATLQQALRVTRSGGSFLMVLEDMQPCWTDLLGRHFERKTGHLRRRVLPMMLRSKLGLAHWPVQADHILIRERDIRSALSGSAAVTFRGWMGGYLTYEVQKGARAAGRAGVDAHRC
jgi:ubiquinone/menaquinone biosynthesis C-methylase UbiE